MGHLFGGRMTAIKIYEDYDCIISEHNNGYNYYDKELAVMVTTDNNIRSSKVFKDDIMLSSIGFKLFSFDYFLYSEDYVDPTIKKIIRLAKYSIKNCIHIHFEKDIIEQVFSFCKKNIKNEDYSISVNKDRTLYPYYQYAIEITDLNKAYDQIKYKAIIRDGIVYFSWVFEDESNYDNFLKSNFENVTVERFHHEDDIITTFMTSAYCIDIHYKAKIKEYDIMIGHYDTLLDGNVLTATKWGDRLIIQQEYDVDFVARKALELVILNTPKESFIKTLKSMDLMGDSDILTIDVVDVYQMATI